MQIIRSTILFLASATLAFAHKLPSDATDGHWKGTKDATTGKLVWTQHANLTTRSTTPIRVGGGSARPLPRRDAMERRDEPGCTDKMWAVDSINNIIDARHNINVSLSYLPPYHVHLLKPVLN